MENKSTNAVELLPKGGQFIITLEDGTKLKGRFSIEALSRFMEAKGIDNYLDLVTKIGAGMNLHDYCDIIMYALADYPNSEPEITGYNRKRIAKIVDEEWNGIQSDEFWKLMKHALSRLMTAKPEKPKVLEETADEKKSD